jgi:NAD(P)H-hydrate repair Nnr-like enzyme with NAD(P)H-hydrate dehydratase domain
VLARRPEAVTAEGRVQAWVLGSGVDPDNRRVVERMRAALTEGVPAALDAGALGLVGEATGPVILTPHAGELARMLGTERAEVTADPEAAASTAADRFGATVLLKGSTTHVRGPGIDLEARTAPPWLATAGAGDALGGILGALLATHRIAEPDDLARLAATAAVLHGLAAQRAGNGGPFTVLHLCHALPATIADLLRTFR